MSSERPPLSAITNGAVELHREHFGRGPGAARSHVTDDLIVCVLTGVFTPLERALIEAGNGDRVREIRSLHQIPLEEAYMCRMTRISGRTVTAHMNTVDVESDVSVDVFLLEGADRPDGQRTPPEATPDRSR